MEPEVPVLLVEDDAMACEWVRMSLEGSEFRLVGEAAGTAEAIALLDRRRPALLLVDHRLPDQVGIELVRDLRRRGVGVPALLMTANPERGFNEGARQAGAQGSVLETGKPDELLRALRAVSAGESSFDRRHPPRPAWEAALGPREREVLRLVASGRTNREVASVLGVRAETVKTLVARTYAKLGARRRAEAVRIAHERGLL